MTACAARDVEPMERSDVVIVSTVSAIYGLGDPETYKASMVTLERGQRVSRDDVLRALVRIQYNRNDVAFERGTFRVRGDTVEIFPAYEEQGVRVELWGDEVERISKINILTGETIATLDVRGDLPGRRLLTSGPAREAIDASARTRRRLARCGTREGCSRRSGSSRARTSTSR